MTSYTAAEFISDCINRKVNLNDELLNYLCPTNRERLKQLLKRLEHVRGLVPKDIAAQRKTFNKVVGAIRAHKHVSVASVQGVKSTLTGKLLERIIKTLVDECQPVEAITNLRTTTAEIDVLLQLGVSASVVPMLSAAGTHIIGEAKCYMSGFKQEWVNELSGLMQQHLCTHSILFVGCPSKVLQREHRFGLQLHAANGHHVVPMGLKQLTEVADGANFLDVLGRQYVDSMTGAVSLSI